MHRHPADEEIDRLAAAQFGIVSRSQAVGAGLSARIIDRRVGAGWWERPAPSTYRVERRSSCYRQRCWIAYLHAGPDSFLCDRTGCWLHGLAGIEATTIDLTVRRGSTRALEGTNRRRPRVMDRRRLVEIDGLPVTDIARSIIGASEYLSRGRVRHMLRRAEQDHDVPITMVSSRLAEPWAGGPGRNRRTIRAVLDSELEDHLPAASEFERRGRQLWIAAGLPTPVPQFPLPSNTGQRGFVDLAWPEAMLIVEFDGRRWHERKDAMKRDSQRDMESSALGWLTVRILWEDLVNDFDGLVAHLRSIHAQRLEDVRARQLTAHATQSP